MGFRVVDGIAKILGTVLYEGPGEYLLARGWWCSKTVLLVKPTTYMNNSGIAVRDVTDRFSVPLDELLIVFDDVSLPLGTIRLRRGGSDGGHNGLASIIERLESEEVPRLRCGIGQGPGEALPTNLVDFVLTRFGKSELAQVESMVRSASEAALAVIAEGFDSGMSQFNIKKNN